MATDGVARKSVLKAMPSGAGTPVGAVGLAGEMAGSALPRPLAEPPPTKDRPTVSGAFMQDYVIGASVSNAGHNEVVHTGRDGTVNIYRLAADANTLERIHADAASTTGWGIEKASLPPLAAPACIDHRIVVAPAGSGADQILVYRQSSLARALLAEDGQVGAITMTDLPANAPFAAGVLPDWVTHVVEFTGVNPDRSFGGVIMDDGLSAGGVVLRDLVTMEALPVDGAAISVHAGILPRFARSVFPLKRQAPGTFAFILHDERQKLAYVRLRKAADGSGWQLEKRIEIGQAGPAMVHAFEDLAGSIEVVALFGPGLQAPAWQIQSWMVSCEPGADPRVGVVKVTQFKNYDQLPRWGLSDALPLIGMTNAESGAAELFVTRSIPDNLPPIRELWGLSRRPGEDWRPPQLISGVARPILPSPREPGLLATFDDSLGLIVWNQTNAGGFEQEQVHIEAAPAKGAARADSQVYRIGLELPRTAADRDGHVMLLCEDTIVARVNGRRRLLKPGTPLRIAPDGRGAIWIELEFSTDLELPALHVSGPHLDGELVLRPGTAINDYLAKVSADALRQARDPRDGSVVLPNPANAEAVAQAMRNLAGQIGKPLPPPDPRTKASASKPTPPLPQAQGQLSAAMVAHGTGLRPLAIQPAAVPRFRLSGSGDDLRFEPLGPRAAKAHAAAMATTASVVEALSWNPIDWARDGWDWLSDKAEQVTDFIVDGVKATVRVIVDGAEMVFNFALDTVKAIHDAIGIVLKKAGILIGKALGWLLDQLGWLFDWSAIKARRDRIRAVLRQQAAAVGPLLGDPSAAFAQAIAQLQKVRDTLVPNAQQLTGSGGALGRDFGALLGMAPSQGVLFASGMLSGAPSLLPQVEWLIDKALPFLLGGKFDPGLPDIPGLSEAIGDLLATITTLGSPMDGMFEALRGLASGWVSVAGGFEGASAAFLVPFLGSFLDSILQVLQQLVAAIGRVMAAIVNGLPHLLDWFDRPAPDSFFGGFYEGLVDHELSVLDFCCLIAAIPADLGKAPGSGPGVNARTSGQLGSSSALDATDPVRKELREVGSGLLIAGAVVSGLAATYSATIPNQADRVQSWIGYFISACDTFMQFAASLAMDAGQGNAPRFWISLVGPILAIAEGAYASGLLGSLFGAARPANVFSKTLSQFQINMAIVLALKAVSDTAQGKASLLVADVLGSIQNVLKVAVREMQRPLKPWPLIPIYGTLQGGVSGLRAWLVVSQPL